jgi:hypothetical protein
MWLLRHLARRLGLDRNPLRRASDRIESAATIVLLSILLIATPALACDAGDAIYQHGVRVERAEQRARVQTRAVVLEVARDTAYVGTDGTVPVVRRVPARWTAPDGAVKVGDITATAGAVPPPGTAVTIWLNSATGRVVDPPRRHGVTVVQTAVMMIVVALAVALPAIAAHRTFRQALDRRRLARWQEAWIRVEPQWSGRRR